jgi:nitrite reductase (NO-forming)/hydroxylamine reductase
MCLQVCYAADKCEGDFDFDGDTDGSDLAVFAAEFGRIDCSSSNRCSADFDDNGDVDEIDLAIFVADFGRTDCSIAGRGADLFTNKCSFCHGRDVTGGVVGRDIRERADNPDTITNVIKYVKEMEFLSYLSETEKGQIADYIASVPKDIDNYLEGYKEDADNGEAIFRKGCAACHSLNGGKPRVSDLANWNNKYSVKGLAGFLVNPPAMIDAGILEIAAWGGRKMPNIIEAYSATLDLTGKTIEELALDAADFLLNMRNQEFIQSDPIALTAEEFQQTKHTYFNRCAGCHGLYRTGATGPNIGEARAQEIGADALAATIFFGTSKGMPAFGTSEVLSQAEAEQLASYLLQPPPEAPGLSLQEIQDSWQPVVPVSQRPSAPAHSRNWENFFGIVLRDVGQVAIVDGDTKEEIVRIDAGFAVHILRSSSSGRYFYAIGRDGVITMIDLWASTPNVVAQVKGCHDARSVDASKFQGYEDNYVIEGCYWPPQYVVYDGQTLEPLSRVDIPMERIDGEILPEVRVDSIVASPFEPSWVIALKESGYVGIVNYSQQGFPLTEPLIPAELFLHDGGWDQTGRYFLVAANASNKMVIIDVKERGFVTSFDTGAVPHPGRGVNWWNKVYGWLNATPHIGEAKISIYGADPDGSPQYAWKVVHEIALPAAGSLFIKSHEASPYVFVDMPLSLNNSKEICAFSKEELTLVSCFPVAVNGAATHLEFNKNGTELWVSDWATNGNIMILDSKTLELLHTIEGLPTPTGKFNVYNTANDIY